MAWLLNILLSPCRRYMEKRGESAHHIWTDSLRVIVRHSAADLEHWSLTRRRVGALMHSRIIEVLLAVSLLCNLGMVIAETDLKAEGKPVPAGLVTMMRCFLAMYCVELVLRIYVERKHFFEQKDHIVDFASIAIDLICELSGIVSDNMTDLPAVSILRMIRVLRLIRVIRFVKSLRELSFMLMGLSSSLKAGLYASIFLFFMLTMWSIIAVEIVHPLNQRVAERGYYDDCQRCARAFSSVMQADLTFAQQIIAGDSWGQVTVPIIMEFPVTTPFFLAVLLSVNLGVMNLVLAVIVDAAVQAHDEDLTHQLDMKEMAFRQMAQTMKKTCQELDTNQDGFLSYQELERGYDTNLQFAEFINTMDCRKEDLEMIFGVLDKDGDDRVSYEEFIDQIHKIKTQNLHTIMVHMQYQLKKFEAFMLKEMSSLQTEFASVKERNTVILPKFKTLNGMTSDEANVTRIVSLDGTNGYLSDEPGMESRPGTPMPIQGSKDEEGRSGSLSPDNAVLGPSKVEVQHSLVTETLACTSVRAELDYLCSAVKRAEEQLTKLVQRCDEPHGPPAARASVDTDARAMGPAFCCGVRPLTLPQQQQQERCLPARPNSAWRASLGRRTNDGGCLPTGVQASPGGGAAGTRGLEKVSTCVCSGATPPSGSNPELHSV